jgi:hypothetical protein
MTVGEARAVMVETGRHTLPVANHYGLIGLLTIEALGGDGDPPPPDAPVISVMDLHLVRLPPDADEELVLRTYVDAAWTWLRNRGPDAHTNEHQPSTQLPDDATGPTATSP